MTWTLNAAMADFAVTRNLLEWFDVDREDILVGKKMMPLNNLGGLTLGH